MESGLLRELAEKAITKQELLKLVESNFELLPLVISGVGSSKATVRYTCAKVLVDLSKRKPKKMYKYMDFFVSLLNSKYRILIWNALAAIGYLSAVDVDRKFDQVFEKYYGLLKDEYMVTVANVVGNSAIIALSKPYLAHRITEEILGVDKIAITPHLTNECKRVIAETAIETFDEYYDRIDDEDKMKVVSFVKKHAKSSRVSLKKKACAFLKRWCP
ncbi:MAG TPA: hypothetical protein VF893_07190 [Candidatus Bathyarchaeia archaeon]